MSRSNLNSMVLFLLVAIMTGCVSSGSTCVKGNCYTCVQGDCRNGSGRYVTDDGTKYVGKFQNGECWKGTMTWTSGEKYVGQFVNGLRNGQGTYYYENGSKYIGEWKDENRHGHGTYTDADGWMYIGEWKNHKQNGQGRWSGADGRKYTGGWKNSKIDGHGTFTGSDGWTYVGAFKSGKKNGHGTLTKPNGYKYTGKWQNDSCHGHGTKIEPDGSKYVGQYSLGWRQGYGTRTLANGDKYSGQWKKDKYHGQGTMYFAASGKTSSGIWENGELVNQGGSENLSKVNSPIAEQQKTTKIRNPEYSRIEDQIVRIDKELAEVQNQMDRNVVEYGKSYHDGYKSNNWGNFIKGTAVKHMPKADALQTKRRNLLVDKNRLKNKLESTPMYINVASPSQSGMQDQNNLQPASFGSEAERNRKIGADCRQKADRYSDGDGQTTPMCQQAIYNQCLADSLCGFYPAKCDKMRSRVPVSCDILSGMGDQSCPPCN
ncbi:MAG: hypothetical protein GY702_23800 [Desulfobulbaceae bacterium]|nr:hypothetical protein [Desulfobulbaceae bacterium]